MIVDTSALIAILRREPDAPELTAKLTSGVPVRLSAGTLLEARIVAWRDGEQTELHEFLDEIAAQVVPVDQTQVDAAFEGFLRYGKGRNPAALNLGDLFAYALAKTRDESLLFKGNDFTRTDLRFA